jgi:tRNA-Thr(GGU) m(6)t(6)A37 methyltransferase TsaA
VTATTIGRVRSAIVERADMPAWGAPARVEVFPEFEPALWRIEKHTHLWVLAWLEGEPLLQVKPRGRKQEGSEALHGVFAVRSPARPTPIGLTAARLLLRDGLTLHFDRLDFVDSTPVVDLKPYFPSRDLHFSAHSERTGSPVSDAAVREGLIIQASAFCGRLTPDAALAVRIVEHYRLSFHGGHEPESWHIAAPLSRPELIDALMGLTRVSPGRGTLGFHSPEAVQIGDQALYILRAPHPNPFDAPFAELCEFHPAAS